MNPSNSTFMGYLEGFFIGVAAFGTFAAGFYFARLSAPQPAPVTSTLQGANCNFDLRTENSLKITDNSASNPCTLTIPPTEWVLITLPTSTNTESGQVRNTNVSCSSNNTYCGLFPATQVAPTSTITHPPMPTIGASTIEDYARALQLSPLEPPNTLIISAPISTIIPTVYDHCEDMNASDCISAYESSYAPFIVETSTYLDIIHSYFASTSIEYTDVIAKQNGQLSIPLSTSSEVDIFRLDCNGTFLANIQHTSGYLDEAYPFDVSKCDELHVSSILPRQQPTSTEWSCADAPTYIGQGFSPSIKTYKEFLPNGSELYFTFNTFGTSTPESEGYSDCTQIN